MEYNIIVAPNLETLATEVAGFLPKGWKLKGGIFEHTNGFAQQLVRNPSESIRIQPRKIVPATKPKRTKWIE